MLGGIALEGNLQCRHVHTVFADVRRRDHPDYTRPVSPLRAAPDAVVVDASDMSEAQLIARVLDLVEQRSGRLPFPVRGLRETFGFAESSIRVNVRVRENRGAKRH